MDTASPIYEPILANIRRYVTLTDEEADAFTRIIRITTIRKRQFIVQPGFVCDSQTYVESGAMRSYYVSPSGVEHTVQFAIEDWFISDFASYIYQEPASLFVEALESGRVFQINYRDTEALCQQYHVFDTFFRLVTQKSFAFAQRRVLSNLGKTAKERYEEFLALYPSIVQRVPQYMLASYLGMSAEFLSRIRAARD